MKNIIMLFSLVFLGLNTINAQEKESSVKIQTSAQCSECKERIETALAFEKGIKSSELDLDTKILTVKYKPSKTNPESIRKAVSKIGYNADDVKKDEKAYAKLPGCCKLPDDPDHVSH